MGGERLRMGRAGVFFPSPSLSLSSLARVRRFGPPFRLLTSSFSRSRAAWLCVTSRDTRLPPSAPSSWDSSRTIGSRLWMSRGRGRNERRVPRPDMMGRVCMSASVCLCVSVCVLRAGLSGRRGRAAAEGGGRERTCAGAGGERRCKGRRGRRNRRAGGARPRSDASHTPLQGGVRRRLPCGAVARGRRAGCEGARTRGERERERAAGAPASERESGRRARISSLSLSLCRAARGRALPRSASHTHTRTLSLCHGLQRGPLVPPGRPPAVRGGAGVDFGSGACGLAEFGAARTDLAARQGPAR